MTLEDGQISFNGYVLGDNSSTFTTELTGWDDLPPVTSGNVPRAGYMGSFAGNKIPRERVITWIGRLNVVDQSEWVSELQSLRAACTVSDTETALTIRTKEETLVSYGSVTARAIPNNRLFGAAGIADISIQWTCSDPRRYTEETQTVDISFPEESSAGLPYPLVYPLDYGPPGTSGSAFVDNQGDIRSPVVYAIHGPVENPRITAGDVFVVFQISLSEGDVLTVDTKHMTVTLNDQVDRLYTRTATSSPLSSLEILPSGETVKVSGTSYGPDAFVRVTTALGAYI